MRFFLISLLLSDLAMGGVREQLEPFLESHCYQCHDDFDNEGDLNLLDAEFLPDESENRALWEKVVRRVESGEMPPRDEEILSAEEKESLIKFLEPPLVASDRAELERAGRVHARRLTAQEYEHAVHDLLGIKIPLARELTAETEEGFTTEARTQQLSHFHLHNYLRVGSLALEEAFDRALQGDKPYRREYSARELTSPGRGNNRGPQFWGGKAISWYTRMQFAGRLVMTKVEEDGWYRVTIHDLDAVNPGPDGSTWGTLESGAGFSNEPLLYPLGLVEATTEPRTVRFEGWIRRGHLILLKPNEAGLKRIRTKGGSFRYEKKDYAKDGLTGLRFGKITIERIYPNGSAEQVRARLFGKIDPLKPEPDPPKALSVLIRRFANRAFRRPFTEQELKPYRELATERLAAGKSFAESLQAAYHAILCSPRFLTFVEEPGRLDDHAIAARLSFLLWKSLPDPELRSAADRGELQDESKLVAQIDRLLADPRSSRFVKDFTNQWLDLRAINETQPDPRRFGQFDPPLQQSLKEETQAFIAALIAEDRPITSLLKADFGFLNTRLRDHYRLKSVEVVPGQGMQKVKLGPDQRSGLLTQAAILKVTADGSLTSPVMRGVWVNERILGRHIPPPPDNIPAIEPDIRGAVSIRDQLAKHTDSISCASCHRKIDPAGFALESFDPVGQFRTSYGKFQKSAKVDPSGITPEGAAFSDFDHWREVYLDRPEMLTRAFASQLLSYAVGAEMRFSDRPHLDRIVARAASQNYGVRRIIMAALTSEIFLTK